MIKKIITATAILFSSASYSADWYRDVGSQMNRVEAASDGSIWLMGAWTSGESDPYTGTTVGMTTQQSCVFRQVKLTPPSGKEKEWLSMVLSAKASNNEVAVYGTCENSLIQGTRIIVEY